METFIVLMFVHAVNFTLDVRDHINHEPRPHYADIGGDWEQAHKEILVQSRREQRHHDKSHL